MVTAKKLTIEMQKTIAEKLSALPKIERQEISKKDFVGGLREQIKFAEAQGYTLEQIAAVLKGDGVDISIATMKTYMQQAGKQKPKARAAKKDTADKLVENQA